jgi:serine/threonine-protein kinase
MPLDTVDSLIESLRGRPILQPDQFAQLAREYAPASKDTQDLARTLIRLRWLTVYQAKKLVSGKADELIVGPYVILDKLGEGGMGRVYKAMQLSLGRVVALKVVRGQLLKNEVALKRFQREVRAAAKLKHPNIVTVFDADTVGDRHFLVMEYIAGTDLAKLVKDRGPLPVGMACAIVRQAALGLQSAHDAGFVHRDIKPSNLLIASDSKGQFTVRSAVKILDMGLARLSADDPAGDNISTELTRTGTVIGTPDFMSPEQAKNSSAVDHRSDLYSLGCTFYYLLTGDAPFPNGTPLEKLLQHQMDPPRPVQLIRLEIPPEVSTIVHTLLAKRPEERFQSGAAIAHALEPWCLEGPTSTTAPAIVPKAEAVDPTSATIETTAHDPFDFGSAHDADTPEAIRRPPPTPKPTRRKPDRFPWLVIGAVVLVMAIIAGAIAIGVNSGSHKTEPSPGSQEPPKNDPPKPPPKTAKNDPPPVRDLEVIEKYLPNDSAVAIVFDIKQWQAFEPAKQYVLMPLAEKLAGFHRSTGVDLMSVVERVIIAVGEDDKSVIVLQGRGLVTPRLLDGAKTWPGVTTEPAWPGGPELYVLGQKSGTGEAFAATSETCVIISPHRDRIVDALEKREGKKRTKFDDVTLERGLEYAHARPFAAFATMGLRTGWARTQPAAGRLTFVAVGVFFDEKGMHSHTLADDPEVTKVADLQKAFAKMLEDKANESKPPDVRVQRIADLLANAQPSKLPMPGVRRTHLMNLVPYRKLEEWFAPFFGKVGG